MNRRALALLVLNGVYFLWLLSMLTGAAWLETPLPGGLPAGNLLTAGGLASMPLLALMFAPRGGKSRRFAWFVLVPTLAWLPLSLLAAGNLQLNFDASAGPAWQAATLGLFAAGIFSLLRALVAWMAQRRPPAADRLG